MAGDPIVVIIPIFYLIKHVPLLTSVMSSLKWYGLWGHRHGGNSGSVRIMGAMAKSLDVGVVSLETTVGTIGVGSGSIGIAMMGHCLCQVDWSDWINCFNLRIQLGLVRSSISKSKGYLKTDLRASGWTWWLMAVWCRLWKWWLFELKDGNPWMDGVSVV